MTERQKILRRLKNHKRTNKAKVYGRQFTEFMVYGKNDAEAHSTKEVFHKRGIHAFKWFLDNYTHSPDDVVTMFVVEDVSAPGDSGDRGDDTEIPLDLDAPSAIHIPKYIQKSMKRDGLTNTKQISAYLRKIHGKQQQTQQKKQQQKPQKKKQTQKSKVRITAQQQKKVDKVFYTELPKSGSKRDLFLQKMVRHFIIYLKKRSTSELATPIKFHSHRRSQQQWESTFIKGFNETMRFAGTHRDLPMSDMPLYRFLQEMGMVGNIMEPGLIKEFLIKHLEITGRTRGTMRVVSMKSSFSLASENDDFIMWFTPFLKAPLDQEEYNYLDDDLTKYALEECAKQWCQLIIDFIDPANYYIHPDRYFFAQAADAFLTEILPDDYFRAENKVRDRMLKSLIRPGLKACYGQGLIATIEVQARKLAGRYRNSVGHVISPPQFRLPTDGEIFDFIQYVRENHDLMGVHPHPPLALNGKNGFQFFERMGFDVKDRKGKLAKYIQKRVAEIVHNLNNS